MTARFNQAAAEMVGAASVYDPQGMMEVGRDFTHMGTAFRQIAEAMRIMQQKTEDEMPMHPAIVDQIKEMYGMLRQVASKADDLGPAFKSFHAVDIKRIAEPRKREDKWDIASNRDSVGTTL